MYYICVVYTIIASRMLGIVPSNHKKLMYTMSLVCAIANLSLVFEDAVNATTCAGARSRTRGARSAL